MKFPLYHNVPSDMKGDTLYPLNVLKETHPDLYKKYVKKYEDRMKVMEQKVPFFDCLWNDVIHLSAIHPKYLKEALKEIGIEFSGKYFIIDAVDLDADKLVVWLNSVDDRNTNKDEKYFEFFNPEHYEGIYSVFPKERQMKAWKEYVEHHGGNPLLWIRCPHVLYKGGISLKGTQIIEV